MLHLCPPGPRPGLPSWRGEASERVCVPWWGHWWRLDRAALGSLSVGTGQAGLSSCSAAGQDRVWSGCPGGRGKPSSPASGLQQEPGSGGWEARSHRCCGASLHQVLSQSLSWGQRCPACFSPVATLGAAPRTGPQGVCAPSSVKRGRYSEGRQGRGPHTRTG